MEIQTEDKGSAKPVVSRNKVMSETRMALQHHSEKRGNMHHESVEGGEKKAPPKKREKTALPSTKKEKQHHLTEGHATPPHEGRERNTECDSHATRKEKRNKNDRIEDNDNKHTDSRVGPRVV